MFWLLTLLAYLIGSLSFAILLSRLAGIPDPRAGGSGNPGATNMLRLAGKRLAICTLFGDLLKGLLPVLLAASLDMSVQQQAWIGLAAVCGHLYPLYFRFRGGKGVATAAGALLALYPPAALLAIAAWLLVFRMTRTSSLAALIALPLCLPLLARCAAADEPVGNADSLASPQQCARSVRRPGKALLGRCGSDRRQRLH